MRAAESAKAFEIKWEDVTHLSESMGVTTGASAEEVEAAMKRAEIKKPLMILVCEEFAECTLTDLLEEKVLVDEKVALGSRAFRTVRMRPEDAEPEELLEGHGKQTPRLIIMDPTRDTVVVHEGKSKLNAKKLYSSMRKVADKFYAEKLDSTIKKSLKILAEVDKLAPKEYSLKQKKDKLDVDAPQRKVEKLRGEIAEILEKKNELLASERKLWEMTRRES